MNLAGFAAIGLLCALAFVSVAMVACVPALRTLTTVPGADGDGGGGDGGGDDGGRPPADDPTPALRVDAPIDWQHFDRLRREWEGPRAQALTSKDRTSQTRHSD